MSVSKYGILQRQVPVRVQFGLRPSHYFSFGNRNISQFGHVTTFIICINVTAGRTKDNYHCKLQSHHYVTNQHFLIRNTPHTQTTSHRLTLGLPHPVLSDPGSEEVGVETALHPQNPRCQKCYDGFF